MRPLEHSGDSANIAFYRERGARPTETYVWAEVLRNDFRRDEAGKIFRRVPPTFHVYVYEQRPRKTRRDLATFIYEPQSPPPDYALSPRTVARLIRANL